jgi:predicted TIM-barrel fold metal-dependent hydrolase
MKTIDADAHVLETPYTWSFLQGDARRFAPRVVPVGAGETNDGTKQSEMWAVDDRLIPKQKNVGADTPEAAREMRDIDVRLKHMDELEIDVQVLYPSFFLRPYTDRGALEEALCSSYNEWLAEIWRRSSGRLRWVAAPPLMTMGKVRDELARAKDNGACGIFMRGLEADRRPTDPYFYPLYEAASELDLAICFHSGNGSLTLQDIYRDEFHGFSRVKLLIIGAFHSIIMDELPKRFPKVRFGFIEAGSLWLPYVLNDIQLRYQRRGKRLPTGLLRDNNMYVAVQVTDDIPYVVKQAGDDCLVIGTDYGHSDTSTQIEALRMLRESGNLDAALVQKILDSNPRRLYNL